MPKTQVCVCVHVCEWVCDVSLPCGEHRVLPDLRAAFGPTEDPVEKERIQQSAECCRKILNHVNEEVKQMENLLVRNTQSIIQHAVM